MITLDSSVNLSQFMEMYPVNSAGEFLDQYYYSQGYPGDLNSVHSRWDDYDMYQTIGKITGDAAAPPVSGFKTDLVYTDLDFSEGQSGSPIYSFRFEKPCAEAIIVSEKKYSQRNFVIMINDCSIAVFNNIMIGRLSKILPRLYRQYFF